MSEKDKNTIQPKISVIIPCYNVEKYLRECLDSVVNQTLKDIEIICVNDGSTDETQKILEEYAKKDSRIFVINQENSGVSVARNNGIKQVHGKCVMFLDSDDYLDIRACEFAYEKIVENNSDICSFLCAKMNNGVKQFIAGETEFFAKYENKTIDTELIEHFLTGVCCKLIKSDFLKKNKIFFPEGIKTGEDSIFNLICLYFKPQYIFLNKELYYYNIDVESSATNSGVSTMYNDIKGYLYFFKTPYFKNSDDEYKAVVLNKFMSQLAYYFIKYPKYSRLFTIEIILFKMYLYYILKPLKQKDLDNLKNAEFINHFDFKFFINRFLHNLFSVSDETLYKKIVIFGKKFVLKPNVNLQYKKVLKKLKRKKGKIKAVFIVNENPKWHYQSLYEKFLSDERFEPLVLVSVLKFVHEGKNIERCSLEENYNFFKSRDMNVEYCYKNGDYVSLENFSPDIVFYEQPWGLPDIYQPEYVSKFALICYVPYAFELFECKEHYMDFHKNIWSFFVDNELNLKRFNKYVKNGVKNCIVTGYPKFDDYFDECNTKNTKIWKYSNLKKIIYAPHHSFEKNGLNLATFRENGAFILEMAKRHPETTWIFKPHPRFKYAIVANNVMSLQEIENYYAEWNRIGAVYTEGNYVDLFKTSDMLITDCGSFLAEYLITGNPIIRPVNPNGRSFNEIGQYISQCCYCTSSNSEIEQTFNNLLLSDDYDILKQKRLKIIPIIFDRKEKSSDKIFNYIIQELGEKK